MNILKISSEEKSSQLIFLIGIWVTMSIIFCFVCFRNYETMDTRDKESILEQISYKNDILKEQKLNERHVDTLDKMLVQYNPGTSQVYLEGSITYELDEIKKAYERRKKDINYRILYQLNELYLMSYYDKKANFNSIKTNASIKKNLDECEIGFQQAQNNITIQEALKNSKSDNN